MNDVSIVSRCGRAKAIVGDGEVTYYAAAVSSTGAVSWRFARQTAYAMPRHLMLDIVDRIVNQPVVHKGR